MYSYLHVQKKCLDSGVYLRWGQNYLSCFMQKIIFRWFYSTCMSNLQLLQEELFTWNRRWFCSPCCPEETCQSTSLFFNAWCYCMLLQHINKTFGGQTFLSGDVFRFFFSLNLSRTARCVFAKAGTYRRRVFDLALLKWGPGTGKPFECLSR